MKTAASSPVDSHDDPLAALPVEALAQIAAHFQLLAEPRRLNLLRLMREGERNVGELAAAIGTSPANASRQLNMLAQHGLVLRETRGPSVYYRVADTSVYALCDLVCAQIRRRLELLQRQRAAFSPAEPALAEPAL